ncbi:MAG: hypothetical protein KQI62_06760 [Deltaproteobacteria bacterium]|nr:hypothetical protein [Deltaproteobacteria bacterium]
MDEVKSLEFLRAIATEGETANMWTAGEAVGLDRGATESLGLELMDRGYLEMASLSGAVRLTTQGSQELQGAAGAEQAPDLEALLDRIAGQEVELGPTASKDLKADLATLRAALGRSRPLNPVVKACLAAIDGALEKAGESTGALRDQLASFKP